MDAADYTDINAAFVAGGAEMTPEETAAMRRYQDITGWVMIIKIQLKTYLMH